MPDVEVLRLGHRPARDERLTSHVCLTARAFGADVIHVEGGDSKPIETVESVTERFGGDVSVKLTRSPKKLVRDWDGVVTHLTMYGLPVQDAVEEIRGEDILVVVGSQKVSGDFYGLADYNVGVTNQPHSEVAALAVFLHEFYEGSELEFNFQGGEFEIEPSNDYKKRK
ncbi:MAG: tRNA (cytidine(56)-2'-O)-methyltransferase [Halobacteria archaeon]